MSRVRIASVILDGTLDQPRLVALRVALRMRRAGRLTDWQDEEFGRRWLRRVPQYPSPAPDRSLELTLSRLTDAEWEVDLRGDTELIPDRRTLDALFAEVRTAAAAARLKVREERVRDVPIPADGTRDEPLTIIDTDIGGDPDDALAVTAAVRLDAVDLVITADERDGLRARFGRWLLDELGRPDLPVVEGRQLSHTRYVSVDGLVPDGVPRQSTDVVGAAVALCERTTGPVRWVGMGPMSNLADVLTARPDLADRLVVTQMGGALRYRDPTRAEHNVRLDPAALRTVLQKAPNLQFVISDTTFTEAIAVTADQAVYTGLARARDRYGWCRILLDHLDRWFATFHPSTLQHDALTLSLAIGLPFVTGATRRITVDDIGRMSEAADGTPVWLSETATYPAFMSWLRDGVQPFGPVVVSFRPDASTSR